MPDPINTIPIQQVKAAELGQQREIKLDIKNAKLLALCLAEVSAKLLENYDGLLNKMQAAQSEEIVIKLDGGGL
jgi:antitoxin component of MazEF toxin-antitoxin module